MISRRTVIAALSVCLMAPVAVTAQPADANRDEAKVGSYSLPDPLRMADGRAVTDAATWTDMRRPELLSLFRDNVYGHTPEGPYYLRPEIMEAPTPALGGKAIRHQVRLHFSPQSDGPKLDLLVYLPAHLKGDIPVFVGLNFLGNQAVQPDPAIKISEAWLNRGTGIVDNHATEAARGAEAEAWPIEMLMDAGYGVATFTAGDVYPDTKNKFSQSLQPYFNTDEDDPARWGALATWAWGLSRVYDYLATVPSVDAGRVIVVGHSRYGKAALWAGATDERFAMVISNNSGGGGASLLRRNYGETISHLPAYWFAPRFKTYVGRIDELPVDQHEMIALIAPRPVYITSATEDWWSDPRGEFLAAKAAAPVYRLLGAGDLDLTDFPPPDTPVHSRIAYHLRSGPHAITPYDWANFISFANQQLK
ncbi:MAG: hypothetical protein QM645_01715 [Asticcacaulis sp.]